MDIWEGLQAAVAQAPVCLVEVVQVQGSAPRGPGAWMAVSPEAIWGTIGGGHLEWEAIEQARSWCAEGLSGEPRTLRLALGASLGQCCGGAVQVRLSAWTAPQWRETLARLQPERSPVALFGAGHVGHALVCALQPLPFQVHWFDSRDAIFPDAALAHVACEHSEPLQAAVPTVPPHALVLIMSFSHVEDLEVVVACLRRQRTHGDLPFIGLIGSATKWAVFQHRLRERGFTDAEIAQVTCPIGLAGVPGKAPPAIAVAVTAQLLQLRQQHHSAD